MAPSPAQPDQKQRNLEAELDALLTQIQKEVPDLAKDAPGKPPAAAAPTAKAAPAASPDLVDDQLAAQIQAMLDDASAQLSQGKTPAQITEESLARKLPPEPKAEPPSPMQESSEAAATAAEPSATADTPMLDQAAIDAMTASALAEPTQATQDYRESQSPGDAPPQATTLDALDEDLAKKADVEISGEFSPVHEVIQESAASPTALADSGSEAPAGDKVSSPDEIDALIAQAVAEAAPSDSTSDQSLAANTAAASVTTGPENSDGSADQVAQELDQELAAGADVQAVEGDFESVHEVPPPSAHPTPSVPSPPPTAPAAAKTASTAKQGSKPATEPAKPAKPRKPFSPLKPLYGLLVLINAPLAGLSPSTRNAVGFIGLITLLNAVALILWKLSSTAH